MTNGEKLKEVFPNIIKYGSILIDDTGTLQKNILFDDTWWNSEYKEPTTKNDLGLIHTEGLDEEIRCTMCTNYMKSNRGCDGNCVVNRDMYKAVIDAIEKRIQPTTKNDLGVDCISRKRVLEWLENATDDSIEHALDSDLEFISSVIPQPREGHWVLTDVEGYRIWHCNCSECGKDPQDYIGGSENWWLIKNKLPKFCPNCGAKMVEPQESEE